MHAKLINGKIIADAIKADIQRIIKKKCTAGRPPGLAVILVGDDPASQIYVHHKQTACEEVGIQSHYHALPETINEKEIIALIQMLNQNQQIDGILLQLPLPKPLNAEKILEYIDPKKDVDGLHPYQLGRVVQFRPWLRPCTPYGVMHLLHTIHDHFSGKHAVIVGASNIVGKPMAFELLAVGATVTICHHLTHSLSDYTQQADILVSAIGSPGFIKGDWIKKEATVIDIGMTRLDNAKLVGDIEFDAACERAAWITPVPGGVGPMTVAMLLRNTLIAAGLIH